jgi:hypothetical protein
LRGALFVDTGPVPRSPWLRLVSPYQCGVDDSSDVHQDAASPQTAPGSANPGAVLRLEPRRRPPLRARPPHPALIAETDPRPTAPTTDKLELADSPHSHGSATREASAPHSHHLAHLTHLMQFCPPTTSTRARSRLKRPLRRGLWRRWLTVDRVAYVRSQGRRPAALGRTSSPPALPPSHKRGDTHPSGSSVPGRAAAGTSRTRWNIDTELRRSSPLHHLRVHPQIRNGESQPHAWLGWL